MVKKYYLVIKVKWQNKLHLHILLWEKLLKNKQVLKSLNTKQKFNSLQEQEIIRNYLIHKRGNKKG